ncbi:hypothetical protein [Dyadobacter sp. NIV53]|uniref:hypothetical protein n=1 Tax=Dyadobacter sp. NIV53 TaxID=2861765 RepID=UPI001C87CEC9|nr:hypothetical protein [Dyadobacter sp. NIV53]
MKTLEEIYEEDPTQKIIDEGAGYAAEQSLKDGYWITYHDDEYPEFIVQEQPDGKRFLIDIEILYDANGVAYDSKIITIREIPALNK